MSPISNISLSDMNANDSLYILSASVNCTSPFLPGFVCSIMLNISGVKIYLPMAPIFDGAFSGRGFSTISVILYNDLSISFPEMIP